MARKTNNIDIALTFMLMCLAIVIIVCATMACVVHSYFYSPVDYSITTTSKNINENDNNNDNNSTRHEESYSNYKKNNTKR